jgi:hypothetical protein
VCLGGVGLASGMLRSLLCIEREPVAASLGLAVVVVTSIGGGRPEARLSDRDSLASTTDLAPVTRISSLKMDQLFDGVSGF